MLRNFIEVTGLTPEDELPDRIKGQLIEYSEVEHIYIPSDKPRINNIYEIAMEVTVNSSRTIAAPLEKIVVLDGLKKLKILYTQKHGSEKASVLCLDLPYNTFIQLPKDSGDIENVKVYIVDAYFKVIDDNRIYSYILYFVHANYNKAPKTDSSEKEPTGTINSENRETVRKYDFSILPQQAMDEITLSAFQQNNEPEIWDPQLDIDSEYL